MAAWTDNPASITTHLRARHINELRRTVDRNRRVANLPPTFWSDNPATRATHIRATHFNEVRAAIPSSVPIGGWSVGSAPSSSRHMSFRDINDLRGWVDTWSQQLGFSPGPDPVPQGVTSFTVNPNSAPAYHMIDQTWVNDILALGTSQTGPLLLRSEVTADVNNNVPNGTYGSAFGLYNASHLTPHALLASGFDLASFVGAYNAPLTTTWTNPYIVHFTQKAATFASQVAQSGVTRFIIWNEPNDTGGAYLDGNRFASIIHEATRLITAQIPNATIFMGGILWPNGAPAPGGGT